MTQPVLALKGVKKSYGSHEVLKGVNMQVNAGDIYGLIGRNGAGKTTLFKLILGLSVSNAGTISICGAPDEKGNMQMRKKMGFFLGPHFYDYMSGRANLDYHRRMKGVREKGEVDRVLKIVGLDADAASHRVSDYSLGMQQRLGIANALLGNPEILILDEPANGLDPQGIAGIRHLIQYLNEEEHKTVIVSSHILGELEHTAHRFGVVNEGILVKELTSEDLQTKSHVSALEIADKNVERAQQVLAQNGIDVLQVKKAASSLEDFYFHLVGSDSNIAEGGEMNG